MTVPEMLLEVADRCPTAPALVDGEVRMDFQSLVNASGRVAERLREFGVEPGDTVGILLPNSWQYAVTYFGAQLAGAITVLVNTRFTVREVEHVCADSGVAVVITNAELAALVESSDRSIRAVDVAEIVDAASGSVQRTGVPIEDLPGLRSRGSDVAQLLYTSGTTGHPKGVMQLHSNLMFNARTVRERLGAAPGERTLIAAPMFHAIGIVSQLVGFIAAGATCVIMPTFEATKAVRLIVQEKVTIFAGVAAMLRLILLKADGADADLSHLKSFVMGGSPVPASLPGEIAARLPDLVLANVWGLTEATSIATFTDGADYLEHPNSAGKPIDGVAVQVSVDGAPPSDVRNAVGELCVKGPVVTGGYWNNFVATAETYVDEWLHTGDVGYIDDDGHVHVKDRLKDMIIRGGENIYSLEVETVLGTHPDVAEVAVIGIPDDVLGEKVCAVIVPADEDRPPTTVELTAHAAKSLADYKIPAVFRLASQLPRNATGKVLKRALTATSQTMIGDTLK